MHSTSFRLSRITYVFLGIVAGVFIGTTIRFVYATWSAPTATPPGDNVSAPVNVSDVGQQKTGNLSLNTSGVYANALLIPSGNVGIGTIDPAEALDVNGRIKIGNVADDVCDPSIEGTQRYNKTNKTMEYCDGSMWKPAFATGGMKFFTGTGCGACPYESTNISGGVGYCYIKDQDGVFRIPAHDPADVITAAMCSFMTPRSFFFWSY